MKYVTLVGDIYSSDAECFERLYYRIDLLLIALRLKLHRSVHIVRFASDTREKNCGSLLFASFSQVSRQFVVLPLLTETLLVVCHIASRHLQWIR